MGPSLPMVLGSGETTTFTYSVGLPDTSPRTNTATAELRNHDYDWLGNATLAGTTNFTGTAPVDFSTPTTKVNDSVTVTDTVQGDLGQHSSSTTIPYSRTFDCRNAGENPEHRDDHRDRAERHRDRDGELLEPRHHQRRRRDVQPEVRLDASSRA